MTFSAPLPFKVSALVFLKDKEGRFLMLKRKKAPNKDLWSPIGGKLEMAFGESPFECARREVFEEAGFHFDNKDLHLFAIITEKNYEGAGHWLMFVFDGIKPIPHLPPNIEEGDFAFFTREEINDLPITPLDLSTLWPTYDVHRKDIICLSVDCKNPENPNIILEKSILIKKQEEKRG